MLSLHNHVIKKVLIPLLHKFLLTICATNFNKAKPPVILKKKHFLTWCFIEGSAINDWAHYLNVTHRWSEMLWNTVTLSIHNYEMKKVLKPLLHKLLFTFCATNVTMWVKPPIFMKLVKHFATWCFVTNAAVNNWANLLNVTCRWSKMMKEKMQLSLSTDI